MRETSLHSSIKDWYDLPGDRLEVSVGDFIVDIVRDDLLIEIQTKNFSAIRKKLESLVRDYDVRLVHPIPERKWIVRVAEWSDEVISRRRSPKKGRLVGLFDELVSMPLLVREPNFALEVLMIDEEEERCDDGKGSWRRRGVSIKNRRLISVARRTLFKDENDFLRFLPKSLDTPFTNRRLAQLNGISLTLARKVTYCLRKMNALTEVGKAGRELLFQAS